MRGRGHWGLSPSLFRAANAGLSHAPNAGVRRTAAERPFSSPHCVHSCARACVCVCVCACVRVCARVCLCIPPLCYPCQLAGRTGTATLVEALWAQALADMQRAEEVRHPRTHTHSQTTKNGALSSSLYAPAL